MDGTAQVGSGSPSKLMTALHAVTSLVLITTAFFVIRPYLFKPTNQGQGNVAIPRDALSLDNAPIRGNRSAPIAIVEFSDIQCPYCGKFVRDTLPAIEDAYVKTGVVSLAFRNLPLAQVHPFATKAAEAAACADRQGKFWDVHDRLYHDQQHLAVADLVTLGANLHLDPSYGTCLSQSQTADRIQQDAAEAKRLGISTTPSFLIGTVQSDGRVKVREVVVGAQPFKNFQTAIDRVRSPASASSIVTLPRLALSALGLVGVVGVGLFARRRRRT